MCVLNICFVLYIFLCDICVCVCVCEREREREGVCVIYVCTRTRASYLSTSLLMGLFLSGAPWHSDLSSVCGPRSIIMVEVAEAITATASRTRASRP